MAKKEEVKVEEELPQEKLPFPKATIVNMIRKNIKPGKQIKGRVKDEMNLWLGRLVEKISKRMDSHPYAYIDYEMFKEAVSIYEQMEEIEAERERIIKYMEKIKSDCDSLEKEVDHKFKK